MGSKVAFPSSARPTASSFLLLTRTLEIMVLAMAPESVKPAFSTWCSQPSTFLASIRIPRYGPPRIIQGAHGLPNFAVRDIFCRSQRAVHVLYPATEKQYICSLVPSRPSNAIYSLVDSTPDSDFHELHKSRRMPGCGHVG
ncbi:hypothetical protein GGU10DRAFT_119265 [Lentinula aff. detonsa]|uniref:Uncharacterized protein n=1 Tax=Lentinula aff. detonsa TaxID=2804958 RepID=A0AA38NBI4_9AGAR|nr:hypothetical protein GGU10DRAFT_119265 [Lentinula aff. detonsa]